MLPQRIHSRAMQFLRLPSPTRETERRNAHNFFLDAGWWAVALGTYQSYLSVFAARLGASNFWIGLLSSGPALVNVFWLVPAGWLVAR